MSYMHFCEIVNRQIWCSPTHLTMYMTCVVYMTNRHHPQCCRSTSPAAPMAHMSAAFLQRTTRQSASVCFYLHIFVRGFTCRYAAVLQSMRVLMCTHPYMYLLSEHACALQPRYEWHCSWCTNCLCQDRYVARTCRSAYSCLRVRACLLPDTKVHVCKFAAAVSTICSFSVSSCDSNASINVQVTLAWTVWRRQMRWCVRLWPPRCKSATSSTCHMAVCGPPRIPLSFHPLTYPFKCLRSMMCWLGSRRAHMSKTASCNLPL